MNLDDLVKQVIDLPVIGSLTWGSAKKKDIILMHAGTVAGEIARKHDWDFVCDLADTTTVANQADYTFEGNHDDCQDIINIRHYPTGSTAWVLLDKKLPTELDKEYDGRTTDTLFCWYMKGRDNGKFPIVTLFGTPDIGGETLRYRYRRNNVKIEDIPEDFGEVVRAALITRLIPDYRPTYERLVVDMIQDYGTPGGNAMPVLNPEMQKRNRERAELYGWS